MTEAAHLTQVELDAGLGEILQSPKDQGVLRMIVCRPQVGVREMLETAQLNPADGLVGDNWKNRGSSSTPDRLANPAMQLTLMNARVIALLARDKTRWPLAGDQLFVDLDLSVENLPPGAQVAVGEAILEISAEPHTGCKKFLARFGQDALQFVNSPVGKEHRLRGLNARVVQPGVIHVGDPVKRLPR